MGKIIWLASYPKSGNTWLRAFLHNLLRNPADGYNINKMTDFSFSDSTVEIFKPFLKKPWQEWTAGEITETRWKAQRYICSLKIDDQFVKTHNALIEYMDKPLIYSEFTAGIIYIVRNPLDVAISLAHHYAVSQDEAIEILNNPANGTVGDERLVFEIHRNWKFHVESWTTQSMPNKLVLRYEDMLERPRPTFGKVARFLGLKPTADRLIRAIENSSFEKLKQQEQSEGFVEKPARAESFFRAGKANQWRNVLTPEQIDRVVQVNREQMKQFGYWPLPK
jgi:hypothetical protein